MGSQKIRDAEKHSCQLLLKGSKVTEDMSRCSYKGDFEKRGE